MTVFQGAVDAASVGSRSGLPPLLASRAAFGIDITYTPTDGNPVGVRVIARRPDTIVGFGDTRIHAETATFEARASEVPSPRPGDQLMIGSETFIVRGDPVQHDPDRLVWSLDVRPA